MPLISSLLSSGSIRLWAGAPKLKLDLDVFGCSASSGFSWMIYMIWCSLWSPFDSSGSCCSGLELWLSNSEPKSIEGEPSLSETNLKSGLPLILTRFLSSWLRSCLSGSFESRKEGSDWFPICLDSSWLELLACCSYLSCSDLIPRLRPAEPARIELLWGGYSTETEAIP